MSRDNSPPFERGDTYHNGGTIDLNNLAGVNLEGMERNFEYVTVNAAAGAKPSPQNGRMVTCRCVRNNSGVTLYAKRLVQLDPTNPGRVSGYANNSGQYCYPVDEFVPAAGVPAGDLFWIVVKGPALCLTEMVGSRFVADIAAGDILQSGTTTTGTTASGTTAVPGRVNTFATAAATTNTGTDLINFNSNKIGRAMSAKTTAQTNADILVDIKSF
jgi:hypothetical protein